MRKKILAVCDGEEKYACSFAAYMNQKGQYPFEVMAFTSVGKIRDFLKAHTIEILLLGESSVEEEMEDLAVDKIIILDEDQGVLPREYPSVFKYQSCDKIMQEITGLYKDAAWNFQEKGQGRKTMHILGVYSPIGRVGKTSFCLALGQILGQKHSVLYLSLEPYSGFEVLRKDETERTMGDLFYGIRQQKGNLPVWLASMVQKAGELSYVPPVSAPEDIEEIGEEEWRMFFQELRCLGTYEILILDLGPGIVQTEILLGECDRIYMPVLNDPVSLAKLEQYETAMRCSGQEDILKKTEKLNLPVISFHSDQMVWPLNLIRGGFGDYVRKLVQNGSISGT